MCHCSTGPPVLLLLFPMNEGAAGEASREASRDNILGTTSLSLQSSVYKSNIVQNIHEQYLHQNNTTSPDAF